MLYVRLSRILWLACLFCSLQSLKAQDTRADTAARTVAAAERAQAATEVVAQAEADLGRLEPLRARPMIGVYLIGNAGLFYTSNPSLSRDGGRGDLYLLAEAASAFAPTSLEDFSSTVTSLIRSFNMRSSPH